MEFKTQLELRKVSQKIADKHVLDSITHLKYKCSTEPDSQYLNIAKKMKNVRKIEITDIYGSIEHAQQIAELGKGR